MDCWYFTQYLGLQIYHYRNHANFAQLFYYAQIVRSDFTDNSISQLSVIYNENINQLLEHLIIYDTKSLNIPL